MSWSCAGCDQNITRSPRCALLNLAHHLHTRIPPPGYPQCHPSELFPRNCSMATPKHNYVRCDTCRSRCANTWPSLRMSLTRSHVPQLPFLLLPTLTLPCGPHAPRARIAPVPGKTRTVLTPSDIQYHVSLQACVRASPLSPAYAAHSGPLPDLTNFIVWMARRYPARRH
jgi:hypothetical protein